MKKYVSIRSKQKEGVLYGEQTRLTVENMSFSGVPLWHYPMFVSNMARVKKACAIANYTEGSLNVKKFKAINKACNELINGEYLDQFPVDVFHGGGGIGINMNVNEVIASLAGNGVEPVDDVNMSQSTSDVCHTAMRMTIGEMSSDLLREIALTQDVLEKKAEDFKDIDTIARTCFQDGMRVSAGAIYKATASAMGRRAKSLSRISEEMHTVNIGWTVIGSGTGANETYREAVLEELQGITGEDYKWSSDLFDAAEYPDDLADVSAEVRVVAEIAAKLARDLRILSSGPETGFEEIILPKVQKGSSFFPGKVNPVIPETVIQCSMLISGWDSVIQSCVGAGEIHINLWEDMMGFLLMDNLLRLTRVLNLFRTRCLEGLRLNEKKCEEYAHSSIPAVVDLREKHGYKELSEEIATEGVSSVLRRIQEDEQKGIQKGETDE